MQQISNPTPPNPVVITFFDYLEVVARRWRMIVKVMAAAFILSVVITLQLPKIYSSTALILPPQQDGGMMGMMSAMSGGMANLAGELLGKSTSADLYVGILNSSAIKDSIIDRFKLMEVYEEKYRIDTYRVLEEKAKIAAGKKDGIISNTVEDKDPKRAADLANAFVEELGKLTVKLNILGAGQNRGYLEERLAKSKADLSRTEEDLKRFQSKNKALDVPEQAKAAITGVAQLKAQLAIQEIQLAGARSRFTDSSREVKDLKVSVANIRAQIAQVEGDDRGSSIPSMGSVPALGQEYVRLMREFKVQEAIFELLTKQYEMAKMSEAKDVDGMQVIQKATVPDKKSKPKRSLIVLASTLAAGFGAVLYAFIREAGAKMPAEDRQRWNQIIALARGSIKRREASQ
jgi:tyrosine-protein kinase Etk/Wzc